ncbi:MAG: zinc-ribbon domain-containing protein [Proteobacteria bacterium]|nr:zinc-ribbon domain-containing protein [Pseudomonadota bacterium]MBU1388225.1 zinc-ribbon domain-containing protein [Pseudomonadota bacterium]MBU1543037.1 zinc-ribbon domain-containing protein [Pseudomonadota bacterium]MBU2482972.1 zinc-ribbon domain-containing protein [Pseudomonadota bacterium]
MIITCDKCSTRFNLDDSLVKENGSNVRCSVCKNMFTAYPISRKSEPELEETDGLTLDTETDDDLVLDSDMDEDLSLDTPDDFDMDDSQFSINEPELEIETPELEIDGSRLEMETSELKTDEPVLEMEDDDLDSVTEYTESEDSILEMDTDFSFEENELGIQADTDDGYQTEVSKLEFENNGIEFDTDDDGDLDGLEFEEYKEDDEISDTFDGISIEEDKGELEFDADGDDFDGLEFEEYKEDESALEMEAPRNQELKLELDSTDDSKDMDTLADDLKLENEEEEFELEFDVDEESDSQTLEMERRPEEDKSALTDDKDTEPEDESPTITPEDDLNTYDEMKSLEISNESYEQEETITMDDTREDESFLQASQTDLQPPPVPGKKRRKKKPLISAPVLVLLLIFFLIAGAYIASLMTGYKIPYLSDVKIPFIENLLKNSQPQKAASSLTLTEKKDWNGRFVDNETAGRLFIITGRIQNISGAPLNHIKVEGRLQTKANQIIKTKEVYCGNILSEETLKNATMETINKQLNIKEGRHKLNVNIKPGATVDYMIVFDNLSDDLDNFLVKAP